MLSASAVAFRAGARRAAPRAARAVRTTPIFCRALSTSRALAATPARDRTREIVAQTVSSIGSKREGQVCETD